MPEKTAIRLMTDKQLQDEFYLVRDFVEAEQDQWLKRFAKERLGFVITEAKRRVRGEVPEVSDDA